jgi:hypothetical protein
MHAVQGFQEFQFWPKWGQWIGLHMCKSAECASDAGGEAKLPTAEAFISLAKELKAFPVDGETVPRFFIVSESKADQAAVQYELWTWNMTGIKGAAVAYPDEFTGVLGEEALTPAEEDVLKLYLLSRVTMMVGTAGSKLSEAAHFMGKSFYLAL